MAPVTIQVGTPDSGVKSCQQQIVSIFLLVGTITVFFLRGTLPGVPLFVYKRTTPLSLYWTGVMLEDSFTGIVATIVQNACTDISTGNGVEGRVKPIFCITDYVSHTVLPSCFNLIINGLDFIVNERS